MCVNLEYVLVQKEPIDIIRQAVKIKGLSLHNV